MIDVLVVDDSDVIRSMILKTLRLSGMPVGAAYEASNGREALAVMEDVWVDLVLADINMPVMDGVEMVERMRQESELSNIPVIVVSTDGSAARIEALREKGIAAYLRKPFTPEKLRDVVGSVTAGWRRDDHAALADRALGAVLERFTFMFGEAADKAALPPVDEECLLARLTFAGAVEGAISIAAPASLCATMARNILGDDMEPAELRVRQADTLGEVLNMAAGHVTGVLEPDRETRLFPPIVSVLPKGMWTRMISASYAYAFLVEESPVLLSLTVRSRS